MELLTNPHFRNSLKWANRIFLFWAVAIIFIFIVTAGTYTVAKIAGPPPVEVPQSTIYYASDGSIIGETTNGQKRYWVGLEDISPYLLQATLAIEDQRFFSHLGFDVKRIIGAIIADLKAGAKVQGASTITQQYARNLFLSHEKTWKRKINEAFYTIRIEANFSKDKILEGYLNTIYYGHGTYGVEAASRYYFNKSASELTLSEAAMLAAIPKGPSSFSPFNSWEKAKSRQELILSVMTDQKMITEEEALKAAEEPLQLYGEDNDLIRNVGPYFQDMVRSQLTNDLEIDERTISLGGLRIYTTLDPKIQKIAEEQVEDNIDSQSEIQAAFIAMDPKTGYVKALIGGRDYSESSYNRAVQSLRQPGSTIKPILYYAALDHGFTPSTTFQSEPTTFTFEDGREPYTPSNFNYQYAEGEISMLQALAVSDNVYAVKTHLYLGMDTLIEYAKKFGIESKLEEVPSLALGTSGVKLIEMANAYSYFANGGKYVEPVFITKVVDRDGEIIYEHKRHNEQVLDPDLAFVMSHMMTGIFDETLNSYANVTGNNIISKTSRVYAGKSGSTNTDSWMIGFTPNLVAGVWTGYDKGKSITVPAEKQYGKHIWVDFMEEALKGTPAQPFKPTKGVVGVYIDPDSGLLAADDCPRSRYTYFVKGTEPKKYCSEQIPAEEQPARPDQPIEEQPKSPWYRKIFDWLGGNAEPTM